MQYTYLNTSAAKPNDFQKEVSRDSATVSKDYCVYPTKSILRQPKCPTPGCDGTSNTRNKGTNQFLTHTSEKYCPFALRNSKAVTKEQLDDSVVNNKNFVKDQNQINILHDQIINLNKQLDFERSKKESFSQFNDASLTNSLKKRIELEILKNGKIETKLKNTKDELTILQSVNHQLHKNHEENINEIKVRIL